MSLIVKFLRARKGQTFSLFAAVLTGVALIVTLLGFITGYMGIIQERQDRFMESTREIKDYKNQLDLLELRIDKTENDIETLTTYEPIAEGDVKYEEIVRELEEAKIDIAKLEKENEALEDIFAPDPVESLKLVMVKNDLENLKEQRDTDLETINGRIGSINTMVGWILILMGGVVASLIASVVSMIRSYRPIPSTQQPEREGKSVQQ